MREVLTYPLEPTQVREELGFVLEYFRALGYRSCEVLFGWSWGNDYYLSNEWTYATHELEGVIVEVERVERAGLGRARTR
jgi:hypothetical protein